MAEDTHTNRSAAIPPGWYPDATGAPGALRYFDGRAWTHHTHVPDGSTPPTYQPRQMEPPRPQFPTAQSLLVGLVPETFTRRRKPTSADPGWYADPARTRKLRFYDGRGWTARTRVPLDQGRRKLPKAAVALQAKVLERADAKAVASDAGHKWRNPRLTINRPSALPAGLHVAVRTRAGRVGGMVSITAMVSGLMLLIVLSWQHWLSSAQVAHEQDKMRAQVEQQLGEDLTSFDTSDPTPIAIPGATPESAKPNPKPGTKPGNTGRPGGATKTPAPKSGAGGGSSTPAKSAGPRDISPFPPKGWKAPPNRKRQSVRSFGLGKPVGRIAIPRIGVDMVMVAGTSLADLSRGAGVAPWGVVPGQPGNAVVAAHRTSYGAPFRNIDDLRYGDQIIVDIPGQSRAVFEVRGHTVVDQYDTGPVQQTAGVRLTLTACHPPGSVRERWIVQAELVSGDWVDRATNRSGWKLKR